MIFLALLYVLSDGHLPFITENQNYLDDPAQYYLASIEDHLANQVVAWRSA